ncbi:hypothetical protein CORC01_04886 [Colletotrichum orchidophilum]|uniref:Uncharacterized protein n=1 Tax=Colletotrichum orchidophilum TaxID=1209926 RepID=A0A1G4BEF6_9PEZI|nr:uncharacterized protein CORC01_04886 [Colletotrichum orchidophilum]OHE99750.1 hypothetical protein CORC01_04886 [Colletotrichum orchidophilum]
MAHNPWLRGCFLISKEPSSGYGWQLSIGRPKHPRSNGRPSQRTPQRQHQAPNGQHCLPTSRSLGRQLPGHEHVAYMYHAISIP